MSGDSFTEVTNQSWFSRIGGAFKGIIIGLIVLVIAFSLLFLNEGRSVKRYKTLKEGGGKVISLASNEVDGANEGRLVHVTGPAKTDDTLVDPEFGVSAKALKLLRRVEMYQWKESSRSEEKKKLGGGTETTTTYSYSKAWSESLINSSGFKKPEGHQNPTSMAYLSEELVAGTVSLGDFILSDSLKSRINNYRELAVDRDNPGPTISGVRVSSQANGFYFGADPTTPAVGDLRVTFSEVPPSEISIIAAQHGNSFLPYQTKAGGSIELLQIGTVAAKDMIATAQQGNRNLTWLLRGVGLFLMFIGLRMILAPLSVLADVVPLFGSIVSVGTGLIAGLLTVVLASVTIGIAWLVYRPLIGGIFLAVAAGVVVLVVMRLQKAGPAPVASSGPPPPPPPTS